MPLLLCVRAAPQSTGGHWIVGRGWQNVWSTADTTTVQFNDGSKGYGGGTSTYWDKAYDVWLLIYHHYNAVIW